MLGAAATEEAMAAMRSIIHKKARFGSMFAILGRGGTKHGAPDELPSSVKPCEFDPVLGAQESTRGLFGSTSNSVSIIKSTTRINRTGRTRALDWHHPFFRLRRTSPHLRARDARRH